jgi:hypothetical protein
MAFGEIRKDKGVFEGARKECKGTMHSFPCFSTVNDMLAYNPHFHLFHFICSGRPPGRSISKLGPSTNCF